MQKIESESLNTKFIAAPRPTASYIMPSIYGIELKENEDVEWFWLDLPDGNKVVIDFKICQKRSR